MGLWSRLKEAVLEPITKGIGERVFAKIMGGAGFSGGPGQWSTDRNEHVRHFKAWTYIAIRAIAEEIAGMTPQVALRRDAGELPGEQRKAMLRGGKLLSAPMIRRNKAITGLQEHEELEVVEFDHPLVRLLNNPNKPDTSWTFWYRTILYLELTGNTYWWVIPNGLGLPGEMWVMPSNWVHRGLSREPDELVSYYDIRPWGIGGMGSFRIPADEMIHFCYPGPLTIFDGWSPLQAGAEWIDINESMDAAQWAAFKEGVWPGLILALDKEMMDPTQSQVDQLYQRLDERAKGESKHKRPMILTPGVSVAAQTRGADEMDFLNSSNSGRDRALALHGVSKFIAGVSDEINRATADAARANFRQRLLPKLQLMGGVGTEKLARRYDDRLIMYWPDPVPLDPAQRNADMKLRFDTLATTPNEIRGECGLPPYEHGGDNPMGPAGLAEVAWATGEPDDVWQELQPAPEATDPGPDPADLAEQMAAGQGAAEEKIAALGQQLQKQLAILDQQAAALAEQRAELARLIGKPDTAPVFNAYLPSNPVPTGEEITVVKGGDGVPPTIRKRFTFAHEGVALASPSANGHVSKSANLLQGGKGDGRSLDDFDPFEVAMGLEVEREHTQDDAVVREIVADHLAEDPRYYSKLREMEGGKVAKVIDDTGREHAADGKFGSGGSSGSAKEGEGGGAKEGEKPAKKPKPKPLSGATANKELTDRLAAAGIPLNLSALASDVRIDPSNSKQPPSTVAQFDPVSQRITVVDHPSISKEEQAEYAIHELTHALDLKMGDGFKVASGNPDSELGKLAAEALAIEPFREMLTGLRYREHEMAGEAIAYLGSRWARQQMGQDVPENAALDAAAGKLGQLLMRHAEKKAMGSNSAPNLIQLPDLLQSTPASCGAVCLLAICEYFGVGPEDEQAFVQLLGTDPVNGTDPANIVAVAVHLGLAVEERHGLTVDDLRIAVQAGTPVMVPMQAYASGGLPAETTGDDSGHYVVVIGVDDEAVYVEDPLLKGSRGVVPIEEFDARWHDVGVDGKRYVRYGLTFWREPAFEAVKSKGDKFDEAKHPRAADGKFGSGGNSGSGGGDEGKADKKPAASADKLAAMAEKTRAKIDKVNRYHNEMHGEGYATTERPDSAVFNAPERREVEAKITAVLDKAGQDSAMSYAPHHGQTEIYSDGGHVATIYRDSIGDDGSITVDSGTDSNIRGRVTLRKEDGDFATEVKLRRVMELPPAKLSKDPEEAARQRQEVADAKARDAAAREAKRAKKERKSKDAKFDEGKHPRAADGKFGSGGGGGKKPDKKPAKEKPSKPAKEKPQRATVDEVKTLINKVSATEAREWLPHVVSKIESMTVKDITALKKQLGLRIGGKKAELARRIADQATRRISNVEHYTREARKAGVKPAMMRRVVSEARNHNKDYNKQIKRVIDHAKELYAKQNGGKQLMRNPAFHGGDMHSIPGFDVMARSIIFENQELLGQYVMRLDDPDSEEGGAERVYDILCAGYPVKFDWHKAHEDAIAMLVELKGEKKDEVPF